ncbi:magnesium chelatase accessory protein [Thiorhodococcus drewsii AZ1]|uniref:Magnesium chelatase accessory protein n=1 Tax=Thiorhodococcus drewsii AZ1 TaxID=765913 RepID=G2E701_9GAMM|nr:alpha/beta fold hydrolase BchO [Thiorhodococcus drewsii]EGV28101.1 magnesium chelatase accessory protein [Thiorhodococcus drewsii AZ1]
MDDRLDWEKDGRDWPNRECSRFVSAGGLRWHVQQMGQGPVLLMLHGTGASTHSWRDFAPELAEHFTLIAPDMPGHGFTDSPAYDRMSLPGMAGFVGALMRELGVTPDLVLGHSAGAAILIQARLDGWIAPRAIISLNGALLPWRGVPGRIFSPAAKLFARNALASHYFAWRAKDRRMIQRLVDSTGSKLDPLGVDFYQSLIRSPAHVRASLSMMANWDLGLMEEGLPRLETPLFLVVGEEDSTVSPREARRVRRSFQPAAEIVALPGLGHLAHEERPREVADTVRRIAAQFGL